MMEASFLTVRVNDMMELPIMEAGATNDKTVAPAGERYDTLNSSPDVTPQMSPIKKVAIPKGMFIVFFQSHWVFGGDMRHVAGWWFQIFFIFTPIPGEMIQFD